MEPSFHSFNATGEIEEGNGTLPALTVTVMTAQRGRRSETSSASTFPSLSAMLTLVSRLQRLPSPRRRPSSVVPRTTCRSVSLVCPTLERVPFSTSPLAAVRPLLSFSVTAARADSSFPADLGKVANFP